jgi:hypothetical protein
MKFWINTFRAPTSNAASKAASPGQPPAALRTCEDDFMRIVDDMGAAR